ATGGWAAADRSTRRTRPQPGITGALHLRRSGIVVGIDADRPGARLATLDCDRPPLFDEPPMTSPLKSREALRKFLQQHPCPARQDAALGELLVAGGDLHAEQLEQA